MVTQVTLGNFYNINGKSVLGGSGGSGLDTQSIINAAVAARSQPATNDQSIITNNGKVTTALNSFQSLLSTFQSAASALRNPPGVNNYAENVFKFTTGSVGNGGSSYVSVTTSPGASLQSYNVSNISQLATSGSQGTVTYTIPSSQSTIVSASTISGTSHQFAPGTITVNGQNITLNEGDSLSTVAADFNAVSNQTGIGASVIQLATGQYQLSFNAKKTGVVNSFDLTSSSTVSDPSNALANAGFQAATAGLDAQFQLNGISIDRASNNISDVVNGVTFNLLQKTPDSTTNYPVNIQPDTTTIQNTMVNFVNAYNAVQTFAAQQTQLNSDGTYASTAVLANNATFRQTMSDITQNVSQQVKGLSSGIDSLSDVGITYTTQPASGTTPQVSNILTVDDGKLSSALATNFQNVQNLFGFNFTSNNTNLAIYSDTNALGISNFTINANPSTQTFTATYADPKTGAPTTVNLNAQAITGATGYSLTGPTGSALDGLQLIYASTAPATVNVTSTQGVADKIYNTSNTATKSNTGTIAIALTGIQTQNTSLTNSIAQINTQVSQYQTTLIARFAALESAISSVNTLLDTLSANANAQLAAAS